MAVVTKFKPIERDVLFDLAGLSAEEQSAALAEFARQELAAAEAQNERALGHTVTYDTFVDGAKSANLNAVKPNGVIVGDFDLGTDLVAWIYEQLVKHSPVGSAPKDKHPGLYRKSHAIYVDGKEIDGPEDVSVDAEEIVITNVVPYARKIEGGLSKQSPDGVYQAVAAMAAARYGNQARIRFTYRSPIGGATQLDTWASARASRENGSARQRRQYQKNVRQPAITISFK